MREDCRQCLGRHGGGLFQAVLFFEFLKIRRRFLGLLQVEICRHVACTAINPPLFSRADKPLALRRDAGCKAADDLFAQFIRERDTCEQILRAVFVASRDAKLFCLPGCGEGFGHVRGDNGINILFEAVAGNQLIADGGGEFVPMCRVIGGNEVMRGDEIRTGKRRLALCLRLGGAIAVRLGPHIAKDGANDGEEPFRNVAV